MPAAHNNRITKRWRLERFVEWTDSPLTTDQQFLLWRIRRLQHMPYKTKITMLVKVHLSMLQRGKHSPTKFHIKPCNIRLDHFFSFYGSSYRDHKGIGGEFRALTAMLKNAAIGHEAFLNLAYADRTTTSSRIEANIRAIANKHAAGIETSSMYFRSTN